MTSQCDPEYTVSDFFNKLIADAYKLREQRREQEILKEINNGNPTPDSEVD
jgi:hypothetical protein